MSTGLGRLREIDAAYKRSCFTVENAKMVQDHLKADLNRAHTLFARTCTHETEGFCYHPDNSGKEADCCIESCTFV